MSSEQYVRQGKIFLKAVELEPEERACCLDDVGDLVFTTSPTGHQSVHTADPRRLDDLKPTWGTTGGSPQSKRPVTEDTCSHR